MHDLEYIKAMNANPEAYAKSRPPRTVTLPRALVEDAADLLEAFGSTNTSSQIREYLCTTTSKGS